MSGLVDLNNWTLHCFQSCSIVITDVVSPHGGLEYIDTLHCLRHQWSADYCLKKKIRKSKMTSCSKTWLWWWGTSLTLVSLSMASRHFQTLPNLGIPVQGITLSNVWLEVVNLCCNHLHFSKLCWSNQNRAYFQLSNSRPRHLLAIPCVCTVCDSGSTLQYWLF